MYYQIEKHHETDTTRCNQQNTSKICYKHEKKREHNDFCKFTMT